MPPRHAYWTIIVDDQPTSFRAHDVEELLPTFNRLREKHPDTQLKWFERGQLWESRDAAREHGLGRGEKRWQGSRPGRETPAGEPKRDSKWRPGGEHRDPRQKYKDAKKAKWDRYKQKIRARWDERARPRPDDGEFTPPHGDPMRSKVTGRGGAKRNWRDKDRGETPGDRRGWRPREGRPQAQRDEWGAGKSWGGKPAPAGERRTWRKPGGRGARKPWNKSEGGGFRKKKPFGSGPPRAARPAKKRRDEDE
jgi:hypothetical protein